MVGLSAFYEFLYEKKHEFDYEKIFARTNNYEFFLWELRNYLSRSSMFSGFCANVLCRALLIPCFLGGGEQPTIPHGRRHWLKAHWTQFPFGRADSRRDKGDRDGSKLYEVNMWLWEFGRGKQRSWTVTEEEMQCEIILKHSRREAWEIRKRHRLWETEKE